MNFQESVLMFVDFLLLNNAVHVLLVFLKMMNVLVQEDMNKMANKLVMTAKLKIAVDHQL